MLVEANAAFLSFTGSTVTPFLIPLASLCGSKHQAHWFPLKKNDQKQLKYILFIQKDVKILSLQIRFQTDVH